MTSTMHTPGPWHRNIKPATKYSVIYAGRNTHVARVVADGLSEQEIEGNCALITAAPGTAAERDRLLLVNTALRAARGWGGTRRLLSFHGPAPLAVHWLARPAVSSVCSPC